MEFTSLTTEQANLLILALLLWSIPWKGVALWKAARNGSKPWFIALLVINTAAILDILYIFVFSKRGTRVSSGDMNDGKIKIMELFENQQSVTNNDVEAALGVSDATATRYLQELENEGKLEQKGEEGRGVYYVKR